jgi:hypothetical protein
MELFDYPENWEELVAGLYNFDDWNTLSPGYKLFVDEAYKRVTGNTPDVGLLPWFQAKVKEAIPDYGRDGTIPMKGVGLRLDENEEIVFCPTEPGQRAEVLARLSQVLALGGIKKCTACSNVLVQMRGKKYCSPACHRKMVGSRPAPIGEAKLSPKMLAALEAISRKESFSVVGGDPWFHGKTLAGLRGRGLIQWVDAGETLLRVTEEGWQVLEETVVPEGN